jgi:hypothetical protein
MMHDHASDPARGLDCTACRRDLETTPIDVDLSGIWTGVMSQVWAGRPGRTELVARRVLRSAGLARALVTTPSLLLSWLVASVVVLAAGVVVSLSIDTPLIPLLAPGLAGAGIAYAYGPGTDPAYEIARTMPISDRMVLLVRALAVFGLNALLGIVASVAAPMAGGVALAWLVPMTAVSALALAAATVSGSANVGVTLGLAGWCIAVLGGRIAGGHMDTAASSQQLVLPYLIFAACCVGIVLRASRFPNHRRQRWS